MLVSFALCAKRRSIYPNDSKIPVMLSTVTNLECFNLIKSFLFTPLPPALTAKGSNLA